MNKLEDVLANAEQLEQKPLTMESIMAECEKIQFRDMDPTQVEKVLSDMIRLNPGAVGEETILREVKLKSGLSMGTLRKQIREIMAIYSESAKGDEMYDLAHYICQEYFGEGQLIFSYQGTIFGYNGRYWEQLTKSTVACLAISTNRSQDFGLQAVAISKNFYGLLSDMVDRQDNPLIEMGSGGKIINCANGELHLNVDTGEIDLLPHNPTSYLTSGLDIDYDPQARAPEYEAALNTVFMGDSELIRHFVEFNGCLISSWRRAAQFWILNGAGSNGKTMLMKLTQKLMGQNTTCNVSLEELDGSHGTTMLVGSLMMLDDDMASSSVLQDGLLKKISEEKQLTANPKFMQPFSFINKAIPVLLTNNYPSCRDLSYGVKRRLHVIQFNKQFKKGEADLGLFDRIRENELPGLLNLFVDGLMRLVKRGFYDVPECCEKAKTEALDQMNPLRTFLKEAVTEKKGASITGADMYYTYKSWCAFSGYKILGKNKFYIGLEAEGLAIDRPKGIVTISNVELMPGLQWRPTVNGTE